MQREKAFVYIDSNFSLGEILMLKMAFNSSEFEIVGLSSAASFMTSKAAAENMLAMAGMEDLILPIAEDASKNIKGQNIIPLNDDVAYFTNPNDYLSEKKGHENLYDLAKDCGKLDIIASGPLTNIARAIKEYDDFTDYVDHIFIFGSSFGMGDISRESEFNFFTDPKACNIVFNSDIETFILPLDLSSKFYLPDEVIDYKTKDKVLGKIQELYKNIAKDNRDVSRALLLYMMMVPEAFIFEQKAIKVDEKVNRGKIIEINSKNKKFIANRVNEESFIDFIKSRLGVS